MARNYAGLVGKGGGLIFVDRIFCCVHYHFFLSLSLFIYINCCVLDVVVVVCMYICIYYCSIL